MFYARLKVLAQMLDSFVSTMFKLSSSKSGDSLTLPELFWPRQTQKKTSSHLAEQQSFQDEAFSVLRDRLNSVSYFVQPQCFCLFF